MKNEFNNQVLNNFVAQRLRQHRERTDVTRENLARHLRLTVDVIERAEAGLVRLEALQLFEACQVFGVSLRSFFEGYNEFQQHTRVDLNQTNEPNHAAAG
ncbi:helix-turn-helix domain-containing protein [Pelagibius sp. Alg239-R121]|uniref:helix-turn-helix domain-containing protein n=1 Tax=Pelagibius sp. Alg239-R121 TaxID=2993448 RepID=UPI0024A677BC|nr:helix-turn-helix transcriptional regulator [Pelagibius sp. Alg239-R121]